MPAPTAKHQSLTPGHRLEEYEIRRELGSGGFGITYIAWDHNLEREVVIKENMPFCAFRDPADSHVYPRSSVGEDAETFAWSLTNFVKEARTLAKFDHPNIVRVLRVFEANGTAYFVMPRVEGQPLDAIIKARGPLGEDELRSILMPLLGALEKLHAQHVYHRDLKPANILLSDEGVPVLIDFGAARQRLSERSMTVVESPGYTPQEQMETRGDVGPWSDLYALAATLYRAITLESPPKAFDRVRRDPIRHLATEFAGSYSHAFLSAIDQALRFDETERPQDSAAWRAMLAATDAAPAIAPRSEPPPVPLPPKVEAEPLPTIWRMPLAKASSPGIRWGLVGGFTAILFAVMLVGGLILLAQPKAGPTNAEASPATPVEPPRSGGKPAEPRTIPLPPTMPRAEPVPSVPKATPLPPPPKVLPLDPSDAVRNATKDNPFTNSLGMKFVPVPIGAGRSKDQRVLFSIWETRRKDYAAYVAKNRGVNEEWKEQICNGVPIGQNDYEPVVSVNSYDASYFCKWLMNTERVAGIIEDGGAYRLPTDVEWSYAVGVGDQEVFTLVRMKAPLIPDVYPWGRFFMSSAIVGNYCDETAKAKGTAFGNIIDGYNDGYATTAPVGSFAPNRFGIYDLGGNVAEWCEDESAMLGTNDILLRGGSWEDGNRETLLSSYRLSSYSPMARSRNVGCWWWGVVARLITFPLLPLPNEGRRHPSSQAKQPSATAHQRRCLSSDDGAHGKHGTHGIRNLPCFRRHHLRPPSPRLRLSA